MPARGDLIPVVQKSYDLCAGLYTHVNRFPRTQRSLLGRVILEDALAMLVSLTVANRRTDKAETLREASGRLDALRITLRLGKHLGSFRMAKRGRSSASCSSNDGTFSSMPWLYACASTSRKAATFRQSMAGSCRRSVFGTCFADSLCSEGIEAKV